MSFWSDLLKKLKKTQKASELDNRSHAEEKESTSPSRSAPEAQDALSELRFKARTGDPKLTEKHRSGNF